MGRESGLSGWVDARQTSGRYTFTREEARRELRMSSDAFHRAALRLAGAKRIARLRGGFFVIVPMEHSVAGIVPPDWFIADLMAHLGRPYYAGLLTAAAHHGASHQAAQWFQVVTNRGLADIVVRGVGVRFYSKQGVDATPTIRVNTYTGVLTMSSPEATALDLVRFAPRTGGLGQVLTVLQELGEVMEADRLAKEARRDGCLAYAQRLGWLLERTRFVGRARKLHAWVDAETPPRAVLVPGMPIAGSAWDRRWRLFVNAEVEGDMA